MTVTEYFRRYPTKESLDANPEASHVDGDEALEWLAEQFAAQCADEAQVQEVSKFLNLYRSGRKWYS